MHETLVVYSNLLWRQRRDATPKMHLLMINVIKKENSKFQGSIKSKFSWFLIVMFDRGSQALQDLLMT